MCDRCIELDSQIEKYRSLKRGFTDQQTLEAIEELTKKLQAERKGLHVE